MTQSEYEDERRRVKAMIKQMRWHRHNTKMGHSFKRRHALWHRGCRKDSY